ncbi:hypothetical protein ACIGZJ_27930 [Kitasatospora sp. NPDC052868]|uniref:hypothetical protein n=1 Tax=Kitasatospora sp. NPDC052868 TaxID=3364060 RepID=UPI0037C95C0F
MTTARDVTDGLTWLAEPQSIAYGGYSVSSAWRDGRPLPDPERERDDLHRTCLGVLGRSFGLALPRAAVVEGELPAVLLEAG